MTESRGRLPLIIGLVLLLGFAGAAAAWLALRSGLPPAAEIAGYRAPAATRVLDSRGRLITEFFQERRRPVPLDSIPGCLKTAVVAVEDRRFYRHWGIDLERLPGLLWWMVRHPGRLKGTSTITQQLARSMFLTFERTVSRKLKEMILAVELERQYSKDEILEMYLNQIWLGGSVYGVEAAAERYFGRRVAQLTTAECAAIAALIANPAAYSPYYAADRLVRRRDFFLAKLRQLGELTEDEYAAAVAEPLVVRPAPPGGNDAPYFVEEVRRDLMDRYGPDFVYRSGATVETTLDLEIQRAANEVIERRLAEIEEGYKLRHPRTWYDSVAQFDSLVGPPGYLQGALVAIDVQTGAVRALVGGRDFRASEYNRATQARRQTGSSFKPFLYAAALDNGFTCADVLVDSTVELRIPGQPTYRPQNYDRKMMGPVTVRQALALSRNLVAVRLIEKVGPELVARYANLLGVRQKLLPVYSLALGSVEVPLIEMTIAFNTLANSGVRVKPLFITRVVDSRGSLVEENLPETQPVISPTTAYLVTSLMQSVVDEGTATSVRSAGFSGPAAGKTGTTDDYTDAWFIGYTPGLCCGVWAGYDRPRTIFRGATGGGVAAPIWGRFMRQVRADTLGPKRFEVPPGIVTAPICEESGELATPRCVRVRYEIFARGTEPADQCPLHSRAPRPAPPPPDSFQPLEEPPGSR
ncbi:PBP1A family penicillin-binding protein [candidate division WOR-3 bacterium]|nr:PBP1A family penicillin-binding protein [candidate division WOR-3 bacterium]